MDKKSVFDISKPGATPANPTSRPIAVNTDPVQTDPMFTTSPQTPEPVTVSTPKPITIQSEPTPPVVPEPAVPITPAASAPSPMPSITTDAKLNVPSQQNFGSAHRLKHEEAFFGHIGKPNKGKKFLIFLLVLIVIGGAAAAGWYFMNKDNTADSVVTPTPVPVVKTEEPTSSETLYTSKLSGFSIDNKYDWKVTEVDTTKEYSSIEYVKKTSTFSKVDFAINDSQTMRIYKYAIGTDGGCQPKTGEVPFKVGNTCSSYEILSADKLPETSFPKNKRYPDSVSAYVVKYKFMRSKETGLDFDLNADSDKTYTLVGIRNTWADEQGREIPLEVGKTRMQGVYPITNLNLIKNEGELIIELIDTKTAGDEIPTLTQLNEADLKKVEEVLKTFKLTD